MFIFIFIKRYLKSKSNTPNPKLKIIVYTNKGTLVQTQKTPFPFMTKKCILSIIQSAFMQTKTQLTSHRDWTENVFKESYKYQNT